MNFKNILLASLVSLSSLVQSCAFCGIDYYYTDEPIYISVNDIKDDIKFTEDKRINVAGKIYLYKNYIFINELNFGIHIIDNTDPKNPKKFGFLKIPLNEDIVIKNDVLYADTLGQLVSIDISDIQNPKVIEKIKVQDYQSLSSSFRIDDQNRIQIGYKKTGLHYKAKCPDVNLLPLPASVPVSTPSIAPFDSIGQSGSLSRFAIVNDYLYTVSDQDLHLFNIKDPNKIINSGKVNISNSNTRIETIFPYQDKLFFGSTTGAYIYDNTNPQQPTFISKSEHIKSCDPIVVEGNKAYVTLRGGNSCGVNNELDIIDLSDIKTPKILKTYNMTSPSGLSIRDNNLFICDGNDGLKIFDVKDPLNIEQKVKVNIDNPQDIILNDNYQAVVIAKDGLHQYDFSGLPNKTNFSELSYISSTKDHFFDLNNEKDDVVREDKTYYYKWYKEYVQEKS